MLTIFLFSPLHSRLATIVAPVFSLGESETGLDSSWFRAPPNLFIARFTDPSHSYSLWNAHDPPFRFIVWFPDLCYSYSMWNESTIRFIDRFACASTRDQTMLISWMWSTISICRPVRRLGQPFLIDNHIHLSICYSIHDPVYLCVWCGYRLNWYGYRTTEYRRVWCGYRLALRFIDIADHTSSSSMSMSTLGAQPTSPIHGQCSGNVDASSCLRYGG